MNKIINMIKNHKILVLVAVIVVVAALVGTLTFALFTNKTAGITNTFKAPGTSTEIVEEFEDNIKKNVNIKNTGDVFSYVRIKLITYRVNDNGDRIGGTAEIPAFVMGEDWLNAGDNTYIYSKYVAPGKTPETDLIGDDGITLTEYTDLDGGKQVVDVVGEIIQCSPADAVKEAWGVDVDKDGVISLKGDD